MIINYKFIAAFALAIGLIFLFVCKPYGRPPVNKAKVSTADSLLFEQVVDSLKKPSARLVHVLVALCDNDSQGIVPVPKKIGNGNDPNSNLYWGCGYGVRTFFTNSDDWQVLQKIQKPRQHILERCVWKHRRSGVLLVADAYCGARIKDCTVDFLCNAAGAFSDTFTLQPKNGASQFIQLNAADLVCYVGHNGLMDFSLPALPQPVGSRRIVKQQVIILACAARYYFREPLQKAGVNPLLWTTSLMAPEAYTLKAAIDGWILNETGQQIRIRAAEAYNQYQRCGMKGAMHLFTTGF